MTLVAAFVPFTYLNDLISAGILVAFSLTDASLVVLRRESPPTDPGLLERCLVWYNAFCFVTAILITHEEMFVVQSALAAFTALSAALMLLFMTVRCPPSLQFGGTILQWTQSSNLASSAPYPESAYFQTPWVPFIPCLGMAVNWYLIAQLEVFGLFLLGLYLGVVVLLYLVFCLNGTAPSWTNSRTDYHSVGESKSSSSGSDDAISLMGIHQHHSFGGHERDTQTSLSERDGILHFSPVTRKKRFPRRNSS